MYCSTCRDTGLIHDTFGVTASRPCTSCSTGRQRTYRNVPPNDLLYGEEFGLFNGCQVSWVRLPETCMYRLTIHDPASGKKIDYDISEMVVADIPYAIHKGRLDVKVVLLHMLTGSMAIPKRSKPPENVSVRDQVQKRYGLKAKGE